MRLIPRLQLFEFHDVEWLPASWRLALTELGNFFSHFVRPYDPVQDKLRDALRHTGSREILDLCSGGGLTSWTVFEHLTEVDGEPLRVQLSDKYPQLPLWQALKQQTEGQLGHVEHPVDALDVPAELTGFRTMYTAFHHFDRDEALGVLRNAVEQRRGIAVFDYTERDVLRWGVPVAVMPLFVWTWAWLIRPIRLKRLVWTYLLPVIPFLAAWDALVSCLRSYEPDELLALTEQLPDTGYRWEAGRVTARWPVRATYLIGVPDDDAGSP